MSLRSVYQDPMGYQTSCRAAVGGGWADGMLNFSVRVLGEGGAAANLEFVCELQLIHGKLLTARKEMGGHAVYGGFRCAADV